MKQQKLTDLALRKIYHAQELGMPECDANMLRSAVQELNFKINHTARFVDEELGMLGLIERSLVLQRSWNEYVMALTQLTTGVSDWIRQRVSRPGGFKQVGVA